MKIKHRHFPYPVLSPFNDDIKGARLKAEIKAEALETDMQFTTTFQLENSTLLQLIKNGQAVYAVHLECNSTMKRFLQTSTNPTFSFEINHKLLNNLVDINFFIIANLDIPNYYNDDFHEDFEGIQFKVQRGDQLAFTETVKMNITKEPIAKTHSIFELSINPYEGAPLFAADFNEKIVISIPKQVYEEVTNLRGFIGADVDELFISMYYVPALIEGLYYIRDLIESEEIYTVENSVWYRSIEKRMEKLHKSIDQITQEDNLPNLAMQILDNNNQRALVAIARIFGVEEEGEIEE